MPPLLPTTMSIPRNFCLICLTQFDLPDEVGSTNSNPTPVATLYKILSNNNHSYNSHPPLPEETEPEFSKHHGDESGDICTLCSSCFEIKEESAKLQFQMLQLQTELRAKVLTIRAKILDSDLKREKLFGTSKGEEVQGDLDTLMVVRQGLLNINEENSSYLPEDVQVKVKIETEETDNEDNGVVGEDDDFQSDSPLSCLVNPEELFKEEDDEDEDGSDCPLFIKPQRRSSTRKRKTRISTEALFEKEEDDIEDDDDDDEDEDDLPLQKLTVQRSKKKRRKTTREKISTEKFDRSPRRTRNTRLNNNNTRQRKSTLQKKSSSSVSKTPCALCRRKFTIDSLPIHMFVAHESKEKPFSCHICQKPFTLEQNLNRHLELHKQSTTHPIICEICDSRFETVTDLTLHTPTHSKSFSCSYCNQSYTSKSGLSRHTRTHTGEKPFSCNLCTETFIDGAAKQWHIQKHHTSEDSHFICPLCGRKFFSKFILKAHMDRHEGKGVACELCGERFNDPGALKTHKITHHGEEPLICDECGSKFMTSKGLKQHKMSHAGEKPHACTICDARFLSKWVLDNHLRSHTGERPFVCDKCGKGFKAKKHLDTHVKSIHSEDFVLKTPFVCSYCGKAYPRRGILEGHVRQVHTGERPFNCEVCSKAFALKTTLRLHLKSHGISVGGKTERLPRSKREKFDSNTTNDVAGGIAANSIERGNVIVGSINNASLSGSIGGSSSTTPMDYVFPTLPPNVKITSTNPSSSSSANFFNTNPTASSLGNYYQL